MKHTIKFRKAILDVDRRALGYYTLSDNSIYKRLMKMMLEEFEPLPIKAAKGYLYEMEG